MNRLREKLFFDQDGRGANRVRVCPAAHAHLCVTIGIVLQKLITRKRKFEDETQLGWCV